jgi:ribonuclease P/MRP protein subunit POP1
MIDHGCDQANTKQMAEDKTPTVTSRRRKPSGHMRLRMDTVNRLRALGRKNKQSPDQGVVARPPRAQGKVSETSNP